MKNYPLLLAVIFSIAYIGITLFLYFSERFETMAFLYLMAMGAMIPMVILSIRLQRDFVYGGPISGRNAAKEGMRYVLFTILFLLIFQTIFFYSGWKEFKMENLPHNIRAHAVKLDQLGKKKFDEVLLQKAIKEELANVTLFKELSFVFYRFIFVGIFGSFISAVFLKTTR